MPTTPTRHMTQALKRELVPVLRAAGFPGTFPRFRRDRGQSIEFLSVQYDKAGTAFILEFGSHPPGPKATSWGELVPEDRLLLEHVPLDSRARLQARPGRMSLWDDWFQFGKFGQEAAAYSRLAASVAGMLPQVEAWLATRQSGPNVSPYGP